MKQRIEIVKCLVRRMCVVSDMTENDEPQIYKKRYKVDKKLGAGNFGTAYLVTDVKSKTEP